MGFFSHFIRETLTKKRFFIQRERDRVEGEKKRIFKCKKVTFACTQPQNKIRRKNTEKWQVNFCREWKRENKTNGKSNTLQSKLWKRLVARFAYGIYSIAFWTWHWILNPSMWYSFSLRRTEFTKLKPSQCRETGWNNKACVVI